MATVSRTVTTPHVTGLLPAGACLAIATSPGVLGFLRTCCAQRAALCWPRACAGLVLVLASCGNRARECGPIVPHSGRAHRGFRRTGAADPGFGRRADRLRLVPILCPASPNVSRCLHRDAWASVPCTAGHFLGRHFRPHEFHGSAVACLATRSPRASTAWRLLSSVHSLICSG